MVSGFESDDENDDGSDGSDCGSGKCDQHSGFSFRSFCIAV